ncbi:MAG: helix-turn-helix transcriptional regulator [Sphingomonas sp.]
MNAITAQPEPSGRFLRMPDVVAEVGLSQATINRLHRAKEFPLKVRIAPNAIGWWESDIRAWKASRARAESRP